MFSQSINTKNSFDSVANFHSSSNLNYLDFNSTYYSWAVNKEMVSIFIIGFFRYKRQELDQADQTSQVTVRHEIVPFNFDQMCSRGS